MDSRKDQFSEIYREYIEKIYRFIYLKVDSREAAEDLTSKVFMKAWDTFSDPVKEIKNARAFLYQIARNTVVDYYRGRGRTATVSLEAVKYAADDKTRTEDKAILNADMRLVREAILRLRKEYQDIIIWHYLDDVPVDEIAQLVGRPEGTVRVMLHRGLKDLKDIIQES